MIDYLVVGLGNPGSLYEYTRHNVGFWMLDELAERWDSPAFVKKNPLGLYTAVQKGDLYLHLLKPLTFMNASGKAVLSYMTELQVPPERVLVLVDDLDLPIGKTRIRVSGSPGTHNGLRSVTDTIGGSYARLRFGIRPLGSVIQNDITDFVLEKFSEKERIFFQQLLIPVYQGVMAFLQEGPTEEGVQKYQLAFSHSVVNTQSMKDPNL